MTPTVSHSTVKSLWLEL